ncbi:hypothetical protein PTKIN_Ptkin08bG0114500 [Pterospermum kingtungense]
MEKKKRAAAIIDGREMEKKNKRGQKHKGAKGVVGQWVQLYDCLLLCFLLRFLHEVLAFLRVVDFVALVSSLLLIFPCVLLLRFKQSISILGESQQSDSPFGSIACSPALPVDLDYSDDQIPAHYFEYAEFEDLRLRIRDNTVLTDVIGLVVSVSKLMRVYVDDNP